MTQEQLERGIKLNRTIDDLKSLRKKLSEAKVKIYSDEHGYLNLNALEDSDFVRAKGREFVESLIKRNEDLIIKYAKELREL